MSTESTSTPPTNGSRRAPVPFWAKAGLAILVVGSWLPLVLVAGARVSTSPQPRVQIAQDMLQQPKVTVQVASDVFADGRAMRPPVTGTVARGKLEADDHYYRGFSQRLDGQGKWQTTFFPGLPGRVALSEALLRRGQQRFAIYCAACHGLDGYGDGAVNQRAIELQESKWVPAASLHSDTVRGRPDGHIFNTITNGIRNMPAYGTQVSVEDRWAIVAYVRALQFSQAVPAQVLPAEKLGQLR